MKMKQEHFNGLLAAIQDKRREFPNLAEIYRNGDFPRSDRVKDLNMRFRWDLFWSVTGKHHAAPLYADYDYLDDSHIDTALRRLVPDII